MAVLIQLVKRHMRLYLRDKASVFFSFLSVIIIIIMYSLFLGRLQSDGLSSMDNGSIPTSIINFDYLDFVVSSWIMAGILTVSTVTVPLASLGALVGDKEKGKIDDFYTAPIDRRILALSYLISSWLVAFFMVFLNLVVGQIYVVINGGVLLTFPRLLLLIMVYSLSIMSFSSLFFYISLHMKTQNAFGLLSTLVGTFIGFLGGIYIQVGLLPQTVQYVMSVLPVSHSVTLIRKIYMGQALDLFFVDQSIPQYQEFLTDMGLEVNVFGHVMSSFEMVVSLIGFGLLFYVLSVLKLSKSKL